MTIELADLLRSAATAFVKARKKTEKPIHITQMMFQFAGDKPYVVVTYLERP